MELLSLPCCESEDGERLVVLNVNKDDDELLFTIRDDRAGYVYVVLSREQIEQLNECLNVWILLQTEEN
jgi:hypothetical protein